jgi:hypothetical protein
MAITVREYLDQGPATSREIQAATGLGQTAVSRQIRGMGKTVIRFRRGVALRYAVTHNAFGGDDRLPLATVDAHGNTVLVAHIRPLAHGGFYIEPEPGMSTLLLGENGEGLYDDLPYFLSDLRPQGFIGRQIASDLSSQGGFPDDPRRWNSDHIGRYLISNGEDLPGNFKFGHQALSRVRRQLAATTADDYPALADNVMSGNNPGSSTGGEQPKFTTFCKDRASHVIVKFSPRGNNDIAQRWRDILITEFHATEALHAREFPAAETKLIELDERIFLESQRFDRSSEYGRLSMVSLQSIDAEFVGDGSNWLPVMNQLHKEKKVSWQHVYDAEYLYGFGKFINNTDMHLGNLSFGIAGDIFTLLPVYDMCSMGFAPKSSGEIPPYDFVPSKHEGLQLEDHHTEEMKEMAHDFWERVTSDKRISNEFRKFLAQGNPIERMQM